MGDIVSKVNDKNGWFRTGKAKYPSDYFRGEIVQYGSLKKLKKKSKKEKNTSEEGEQNDSESKKESKKKQKEHDEDKKKKKGKKEGKKDGDNALDATPKVISSVFGSWLGCIRFDGEEYVSQSHL